VPSKMAAEYPLWVVSRLKISCGATVRFGSKAAIQSTVKKQAPAMPAQPVPDSHKNPRTGRGFMKQKHDELTGSHRPIAGILSMLMI
jgi:hypothetical protein